MEKRAAFYTLGCKVNQYETEAIIEIFQNKGYQIVEFSEEADVYLINTCTVTSISDRKSRQMIRRAKSMNKKAIVAIMGCYSQVATAEVSKIADVDIIMGSSKKNKIMDLIDEYKLNKEKIIFVEDLNHETKYDDFMVNTYKDNTRAYIKVQDGCNRFCSYCIIPYARGRIRSRNYSSALEEVKALANDGFKEIVITGIHLASYGKDSNDLNLMGLIDRITNVNGIERIRLSSLEPRIITEDFVNYAKATKKLCKHFHLSLQSGSDFILERMNRKYTTDEYYAKAKLIYERIPTASITTDIIVGFPGETENDFQQTIDFVKKIGFLKVHVFKYSARKGTKAAEFKDKVAAETKDWRSKELIELSNKLSFQFRQRYLGQIVDIICEQEVKGQQGILSGLTDNYLKVEVKGDLDILQGKLKPVKLVRLLEDYLEGELIF